jgi:hypothetical protein
MDQLYNSTSDDEMHIHENFNRFLRVIFQKKNNYFFEFNFIKETLDNHFDVPRDIYDNISRDKHILDIIEPKTSDIFYLRKTKQKEAL